MYKKCSDRLRLTRIKPIFLTSCGETPNEPVRSIELSTVTYGTNCAPFLATRVIKDIAVQNSSRFPLASQALLQQCYIDDILGDADSHTELETLYHELNTLLESHHFKLHKWRTNSSTLFSQTSQITPDYDLDFGDHPNKVLGLRWNSNADYFSIAVPDVTLDETNSKRNMLSVITRCYDPLGFLSPIIISGKLLIQALWCEKLDWDSPVTNPLILKQWSRFVNDLVFLKAQNSSLFILGQTHYKD